MASLRTLVGELKTWLALATCAALLLLLNAPGEALAQDADAAPAAAAEAEPAMEEPAAEEDPLAADPAMEEEAPAFEEDAAAPAPAKPATKPKRKPGEDVEEVAPLAPPSPAVEAVLESHPQTPAELLRAIDILVSLGEAKQAQGFVDALIKLPLDVPAKAALVARFQSARLIRLARNAELAATLGPFIDDLFKSAETYRTDSKRLSDWARQLADADENVRAQAAQALIAAREASVAPLVAILADPKRAAEFPLVKTVLVRLDDLAVEPLLGVMESPDAALKTQVAEVLGRVKTPRAVSPLLAALVSPASTPQLRVAAASALSKITDRVPTADEAIQQLEASALDALKRSRVESQDGGRQLWHWNAKRQQSMPIDYDATGASLAEAVRLARVVHELDPESASRRRLYLTTLLQAAKFRTGLDKPLPAGKGTARGVAEHYGADAVSEVLANALIHGYVPAATAAAEILGDIGSPASLVRAGSAPSPLVAAAGSADRRLRFAAMNAILKMQPRGPFTGSSHVADGLGFFAGSYGVPRVLVVHPRSDDAQGVAGLANALGYEADTATNGRRAFELATASPDYEIILIHSAIDRPRADELVAQLRRDRRTAALPIGLMATLDDLERVQRFAREVPLAEAFLQPQRQEEMKIFCELLNSRSGRDHVSAAERKAQSIAALEWLAKLSSQSQSVFDIHRQEPAVTRVLYVPELSVHAAQVLGQLGTASSQRSLLELAGLATQPLAVRQAAAAAFARSVRKYGILLSTEQIMAQYDLYNSNAGRHSETHEVLGEILNAIENKGDAASSP